eukprot:5611340-Amphidinium_carterae.1
MTWAPVKIKASARVWRVRIVNLPSVLCCHSGTLCRGLAARSANFFKNICTGQFALHNRQELSRKAQAP